MNNSQLIEYLLLSPHLDFNSASIIAGEFNLKEYKKGEMLLENGKVSHEYFFLEQGFLRSYLLDTEGNEVTLNIYSEKEIVFEVASFFQRIPSQENYEALTDSICWVLSFEKLNELFHALPEFRNFGRSILAKGFSEFKLRTLSLINQSAEERYERLLKSKPEIFQNVPLKIIASYLGITDSSLSRIRRNFSLK